MKQFHRRKLTEPILNILLLPLKKDPAGDFMQLAADEVNAPAHGTEPGVRLTFEIDVPALVAAFQLPHVLAILGGRHGTTLPLASLSCQRLHSPPYDLPGLWCTAFCVCPLLSQVRRGRCDRRRNRLAGGPSVGRGRSCAGSPDRRGRDA